MLKKGVAVLVRRYDPENIIQFCAGLVTRRSQTVTGLVEIPGYSIMYVQLTILTIPFRNLKQFFLMFGFLPTTAINKQVAKNDISLRLPLNSFIIVFIESHVFLTPILHYFYFLNPLQPAKNHL
jgi:hypothetical protein